MSKLDWFNQARYGMFVHWGPYSVGARGEWVRNRERISSQDYLDHFVQPFKAENYDPREWARLARAAGMGYVVLTTRHHDGFCLWDTRTTDFNAVKLGSKRDLLKPYVEALRAEGLRVGFYYSVADWNHTDYPGAYERDWPTHWPDANGRRRFISYYREQLRELMSNYGKIDVLWYDGCIPSPTGGTDTNDLVYALQPEILINERNGDPCDFHCAEQTLTPKPAPWEACITLNENWGYHAGDSRWKTPRDVIHSLITCARFAGNLLLNVGPRSDGRVPEESEQILRAAGDWLARNREFLPNSDRSEISWNNWGLVTSRDNVVYLHVFNSTGPELWFSELTNTIRSATFLDGGAPVRFEQRGDRVVFLDLPAPLRDPIATTIRLEVEGVIQTKTKQVNFWVPN